MVKWNAKRLYHLLKRTRPSENLELLNITLLAISHSNFRGRSPPLTGLQYQYTGYSYNLAGVASLLAMVFAPTPPPSPYRLTPVAHAACD